MESSFNRHFPNQSFLEGMNEEERNKYKEELEAMKKKHKDHKPVSWKTNVKYIKSLLYMSFFS